MKKKVKKHAVVRRKRCVLRNADFVSTGSTMLNLALSDRPHRGFRKGFYYLVVGDSRSGKTFLTLTCLAEAALNEAFAEHRFIHDDVEHGSLMDIKRFFGQAVADRIEPPARDENGQPTCSQTIEMFYDHMAEVAEAGQPFIYILDSMDALDSEASRDKFEEQRKDRKEGKSVTGSYDSKAKVNSGNLRRVLYDLRSLDSILLIVNQTRDIIGGRSNIRIKTRSGGWAPLFYATHELWSSVDSNIEKTVRGKKRLQGTVCKIRVKKNRVTGKDRIITLPIYNSYGVDDVGSCIDFLVAERHWTISKSGVITATDLDYKGRREKLAGYIVNNKREHQLIQACTKVWTDIETGIALDRKPKYV